ncbi:helix-turn-helix transcriptional regulator [Bombilactobacillus thymidiniphilus]|uniref:Helix-turn-helix transcriptional regulator n=1 Tax=Bombilactobacillus thymidiniphilus TaxID=2923363 RepID=A0ABY4PF41_9LACO|nr:helix-turn-helix transcriptional regulator [Bombilactobacillus thymidiniphilus]UQS84380.1 helix-turn-helix transcriptional regulator [Bombilactobacillus thymidiniphilus]
MVVKSTADIKKRLAENGFVQKDLAKRVDITSPYLSSIVNKKRGVGIGTAVRISYALNADLLDIFLPLIFIEICCLNNRRSISKFIRHNSASYVKFNLLVSEYSWPLVI